MAADGRSPAPPSAGPRGGSPGPPSGPAHARPDEDRLITLVEVPKNAEAPLSALRLPRTPTDRFFVRSHFPTPSVPRSAWRLSVGGEVDRPRSWSLDELYQLPRRRIAATLECAGNGRTRYPQAAEGELRWGEHAVGSASWEGVPLATLLEASGVRRTARYLVFTGADHGAPTEQVQRFERSLSVELGEYDDALVATEMNGAPLSGEHGAPARLVVPGWYGMAWVKWLDRIEARAAEFHGPFQTSKYTYRFERDGRPVVEPVRRLRVKSLVTSPAPGERLVHGSAHRLAGKAWSGAAPVVKVEVDVGDGWRAASLTAGDGPYDWSSWELDWTPRTAGPAKIRARATDASGEVQPKALFENQYQYGCNSVQTVKIEVA